MNSISAKARLVGILYVLMSIPGWFSLMYIDSVFIVRGDATATARNITNGELMFRLGILGELVSQTIFLLLALVLYDLLKDVDRKQARLMVILVAISVAFEFVNCLNLIVPLILLSGGDFLSAFTKPQLDALAMVFLKLRNNGVAVITAVWGLWLLPFGVLVFKSGFFPKVLGDLLIVAGLAYVADSVSLVALPASMRITAFSTVTLVIGSFGELAMVLWMIVKGAKEPLKAHPA